MMFKKYKELKVNEHDYDGYYEYEMYPMELEENVFVSFATYNNEGKIPHFHAHIWTKDNDERKELYHVAICLKKPEFYHVNELGILDNKEYLEKIINLLQSYIDTKIDIVRLWRFLIGAWNLYCKNKHIRISRKMPNYNELINLIEK